MIHIAMAAKMPQNTQLNVSFASQLPLWAAPASSGYFFSPTSVSTSRYSTAQLPFSTYGSSPEL